DDHVVVERRLADDDCHTAEPAPARLSHERKRAVLVGGDHRGAASPQGGRDRTLIARGDVQIGQHEPMPGLSECSRRRRNPLALGKRALQRPEALAHERRLLAELAAFELGPGRPGSQSRPPRRFPQGLRERRRALSPKRDALAGAAQPVESCSRRLTSSGGVRELLLRSAPLQQQILELRLGAATRMLRRGTTLFPSRDLLVDRREIDGRNCRFQSGDLATKLLRPLRRSRLESERPQPLTYLGLAVPCPRDVLTPPRELQLGAMTPALESAEPRRVLDERATLLRLRGEDLLDLPLC